MVGGACPEDRCSRRSGRGCRHLGSRSRQRVDDPSGTAASSVARAGGGTLWNELRGVALQLVGDEHTRCSTLLLEALAEQTFGGLLVARLLALDENIENEAV